MFYAIPPDEVESVQSKVVEAVSKTTELRCLLLLVAVNSTRRRVDGWKFLHIGCTS